MMQSTKPKLVLHKLSLGTCCLALTSPVHAAEATKDRAGPAAAAPPAKRFGSIGSSGSLAGLAGGSSTQTHWSGGAGLFL